MRIFNLFFCIVFVIFAGLQYNDLDPYVWMPIYGYCAVLCWLAFKSRYFPKACILGMIAFGIYACYKFFDQYGVLDWINKYHAENIAGTMKAETPWVEETREFFGLVICIAVLFIDLLYSKRLRKPN
jgi:hypothetical protein